MDAAIAEFAALPDCQHCAGSGKQVPDGWYEQRREAELRAAELLQPAVNALLAHQRLIRRPAAPEPDSGPGWNRATIDRICRDALGEPHPDTAQLRALLADRDGLAADLDAARGHLDLRDGELASANAQRDAARAELAEYQQLFQLQWRRTAAATALWRAESPAERELTQPDLGALLAWLMQRADTARVELAEVTEQRDRLAGWVETLESIKSADGDELLRQRTVADELRRELTTARRDAAADALDYLAASMRRTPRQIVISADEIERRAAEVRSGARHIPGQPEPDEEGGSDGA